MVTPLERAVQEHRGPMFGLAYRLLGSVADAEDVVQEAFFRLDRDGTDGIDNIGGWLHRTTSRLCLDRLRSARARREIYVGPWLPEPLATDADPSETVELTESVTMAFLVVLEALSPTERVAFVFHDVFGYGYDELADVLDRSEDACRQLVSRARRSVQARRPRFESDAALRSEVAARFVTACASGDTSELLSVLAPAVVLHSDGGGKVSATRQPVRGAERVTRFMLGLRRQAPEGFRIEPARFNASPGFLARHADGRIDSAWVLDIADGLVIGVNAVRNPDKLTHLTREASPSS